MFIIMAGGGNSDLIKVKPMMSVLEGGVIKYGGGGGKRNIFSGHF